MIFVFKQMRRVALAVVALGSIGISGQAFAQNTLSGTPIVNTATVNYSVATVAQTPIDAVAEFVVDTVIDLNLTDVPSALTFTPGQTGGAKAFTLTNISNADSNFSFNFANLTGTDDFQLGNLAVFVDGNANGTYEPASDTATTVTGLAARTGSITVFVVGDIPVTATNGQDGVVQLTATAINPIGGLEWVSTAGADTAANVEVVVADSTEDATNTFVVASAALSVSKSSTVIRDPFTSTPGEAKAIPSAVVEYTITVANAAGAQTATLTSISDPIPANTTFLQGEYSGSDVSISVGGGPATFCVAELNGVDTGDGCVITGGALTVGAPAVTSVSDGSNVTISFRVTIQ
jgi:uncharacterized repeat protein (TIGR01451 family)